MNGKTLEVGSSYYRAMSEKDLNQIEKLLHPDVVFIGPIAEFSGKEAVLGWIGAFLPRFDKLTVRGQFANENQMMFAYDVTFPEPFGRYRTASLVDIKDGLVKRIELFFDASPMTQQKK